VGDEAPRNAINAAQRVMNFLKSLPVYADHMIELHRENNGLRGGEP
jgi:hypothetical protein